MLKADCHLHTNYSFDSTASMEEMIQTAINIGLAYIALTDHVDFSFKSDSDNAFLFPLDYEKYRREIFELKKKYEHKIYTAFGAEVGIGSKNCVRADEFIRSQPFEFVIGSLHDYNGTDVCYPEFYAGKTKRQAYTAYFQEIAASAKAVSGFHVFGHMDYIERYGRYADKTLRYADFALVIDEALKAIIINGKGIEINTSGFRYGLGHPHPQFEIIKRFRELGGEIITVGSDAHTAKDICADFKEAKRCLVEAGFKAVAVFKNGLPFMTDI